MRFLSYFSIHKRSILIIIATNHTKGNNMFNEIKNDGNKITVLYKQYWSIQIGESELLIWHSLHTPSEKLNNFDSL